MTREFHPLQAEEIARAFLAEGVDYLLIGRKKDEIELPLLESFRAEYEKRHAPPLRSASDAALEKSCCNKSAAE
jgi:hypothetical protein